MGDMRIVFMGTAAFAVPSLKALGEAGHQVLAVVTQPDRPAGRGQGTRISSVKAVAAEGGLPVLQPEKASQPEFVQELKALSPEVIVVVAYGQILRPTVLEIPPLGCINVHGSLLPELRGAAPIQWAILRGYSETGVTTMFMDPGMDTGDIILQARETISPDDTAGSLAERLAPLGARLLHETLERVERGDAPRRPQASEQATYAPMLKREDGFIDWSQSAEAVRNRIHGCNPSPGATAMREGWPVKLWRAQAVTTIPSSGDEPGRVVGIEPGGPVVATGCGRVQLLEVQPESRPRLTGDEYVRGYRVTVGTQFTTSTSGQAIGSEP
jgi:methionyl-tRNA formyltransferase